MLSQSDIRNPLSLRGSTPNNCSAVYQEGLVPLLIQASPTHCLLLLAIEAGDLLDSVKNHRNCSAPRGIADCKTATNHSLFSNSFECFVKVLNNIVNVLCTDRKTDCVWFDTLIKKLFFCALAVCCCSRMDNKRFNISYIGKQ